MAVLIFAHWLCVRQWELVFMSWWQAVVCLQCILWKSSCKLALGCRSNQLCVCSGRLHLCAYSMLYGQVVICLQDGGSAE